MNAAAGLLQNAGIAVSPNLATQINAYKAITAIAKATDIQDRAEEKVGSGHSILGVGADIFPALTNVISDDYRSSVQSVLGTASHTSNILDQGNRTIGSDVGVFAQHFSAAVAFTSSSNEFITSALNASAKFGVSFDYNNLLTGAVSDTSLALNALGEDLTRIGNLYDYNELSSLGNPLNLIRSFWKQAGGLPIIDRYLILKGVNPTSLITQILDLDVDTVASQQCSELDSNGLVSFPEGIEGGALAIGDAPPPKTSVGQAVWEVLGQIKGEELEDIKSVLAVNNNDDIKTAQDLLNPKVLFKDSWSALKSTTNTGVARFIFNGDAITSDLGGLGSKYYAYVPEFIADANQALARSLQQIKNVFNVTSQQLSRVSTELETIKGLTHLEDLESPVPQSTLDFFKNIYGTGSGKNGEFLVTDIIGTAAGYTHVEELKIVVEQLSNLDDLGALNNLENLFDTCQGLYDNESEYYYTIPGPIDPETGLPTSIPQWRIPAGRYGLSAQDGFGSRSAAVSVVVPAIETELTRLAGLYTIQEETTTNSFNNMSRQIGLEIENMPKAGITPESTQTGVKTVVMSLVTNLPSYGLDDSLGGSGWILENVAADSFYGDSLQACLREGRNIATLNTAAIDTALFVISQQRTNQKAPKEDSSFTVDEAKDNL